MPFRNVKAYAIKAKIPKSTQLYFNYFKGEVIKRCIEEMADCVIEIIDGRILLFTDFPPPSSLLEGIKGVLSYYEVEIFEDTNSLIKSMVVKLNGCKSFAARSNKKAMEREIGGKIAEIVNIPVNLTEPQCKLYFERRGKIYLLFLSYP